MSDERPPGLLPNPLPATAAATVAAATVALKGKFQ